MTLQLVRPDIRQSSILLAAVNSRASHRPTTKSTTAIANPAIAGVRFSCGLGLSPLRLAGLAISGLALSGFALSGLGSFMIRPSRDLTSRHQSSLRRPQG